LAFAAAANSALGTKERFSEDRFSMESEVTIRDYCVKFFS